MASPIAHSLAALSIYYAVYKRTGASWWVIIAIVIGANLPDFDLLPGLLLGNSDIFHRTFSHSIFSAIFAGAVFYLSLRIFSVNFAWARSIVWTIAILSHLFIDWATFDHVSPRGIAVFWPLNDSFYMSKFTVFMHIERHDVFEPATIMHNINAGLLELIIFLPVVLIIRKALYRPVFSV